MIDRRRAFKILLAQHDGIFGFFHELGHRILLMMSANRFKKSPPAAIPLTLDISLKTEPWASRNRLTTSCRLFNIESSSPTARVIRPARLFLRLWSMFNSHGEPGARKALYRPAEISISSSGRPWQTYRRQLPGSLEWHQAS